MQSTRTFPVLTLGEVGLVSDIDAVETSVQALTMIVNARCEDNRVSRGPVISDFAQLPSNPRGMLGYVDANGSNHFLVVDESMNVYETGPNSSLLVSPTSGFTPSKVDAQVTICQLNDVTYINRPDMSPVYRPNTGVSNFANLSGFQSGWKDTENSAEPSNLPSTARYNSIRSYNDMLVGIGVQQGGTNMPKSVWWSDYSLADGVPPQNWAIGSTESSGGQNTLAEMVGSLIDGTLLGQTLILHGDRETWSMQFNGNTSTVFNFERLFEGGTISVNCTAVVDNVLYCFGDKDLYVTDGHTKQSIAYGKVQQFVFQNIVNTERKRSFAFHNPRNNEVLFCYVSLDQYCAFPYNASYPSCNRAVVYNYRSKVFYTYDLPYVNCATLINIYNPLAWGPNGSNGTYAAGDATATWASITGSWAGFAYGSQDVCALGSISNGSNGPSAFTLAIYEETSTYGAISTWANAPCMILKANMDGSELTQIEGLATALQDQKLILALNLKGVPPSVDALQVQIGVCDLPGQPMVWSQPVPWDAENSYLCFRDAGRYFAYRMTYFDPYSFRLDGFDISLKLVGSRPR